MLRRCYVARQLTCHMLTEFVPVLGANCGEGLPSGMICSLSPLISPQELVASQPAAVSAARGGAWGSTLEASSSGGSQHTQLGDKCIKAPYAITCCKVCWVCCVGCYLCSKAILCMALCLQPETSYLSCACWAGKAEEDVKSQAGDWRSEAGSPV